MQVLATAEWKDGGEKSLLAGAKSFSKDVSKDLKNTVHPPHMGAYRERCGDGGRQREFLQRAAGRESRAVADAA